MSRWISLLLLVCGMVVNLHGQQRAELEKQRNALLKRISTTTTLIQKSRETQQATEADIRTLQAEIGLRRTLLATLKTEIDLVESAIDEKTVQISRMQRSMEELRAAHAAQLRKEYLRRRTENRAVFLLSSSSLNEAYTRWRYLRAFKTARERTFEALQTARDSVGADVDRLQALHVDKESLLADVVEQERSLETSVTSAESKLTTLRKDESRLRSELDRQKKESARLEKEIATMIAAELERNATREDLLPDAPAMRALSAEFEGNKGQLPWPVERGMITGKFGTQPHPVIPSIQIVNNGVDITAPPGSAVKAVFGGKVVGKKQIPGYDHTIILQHGSYYTVYSRLADTNVTLGSEVATGDVIGFLQAAGTTNSKLHIEVWKEKTQLDPELWLGR
ncbi:MAG: peptidoglycan DD-metalloendopeptidase family protein [Saprospiraceae bacterium]|nr:peptidoglycan DD-metalloendopeptidase family protein [Saprospiraceae bacterium]